ncbi:MAG TPA: hypothetical protein DEE98_02890 [Elusimicrobia bacterium]|nr:MAG: hypothetical protein A2278_07720 [Elusimicrobia bacterium RIFOXYA12_FULL_49_49]OGS09404.1 MAG: hypothetical protein A2386_07950 [Elusimicrobia bacterium RIFOXYB1_FULL_48_9]OGS16048.1 MAG: hypothetical protein A2251_02545 [Elusimicrobia bacterium RIFOXYA2_FULL_47_53]OGS25781.1 MAG: hypothetical protein A2339_05090 [Elusimicrobia bacterium RIFOXYB12_FULL_50_12]OGS30200.1 MAG: hypothetical protein A2323_01990 [Elusimicrobia bacterium RIFOXYB2_FULL_46_23]HBU69310.1 hypothetical protein [El
MKLNKKKTSASSIWLTIYGDWITNLTLFFILLFYTALIASQKHLGREEINSFARQMMSGINKEQKKVKLREIESKLSKIKEISGITIILNEMLVVLPENAIFEPGKAVIKENAKRVLSDIGAAISNQNCDILIESHAGDLPSGEKVPDNMQSWQLALARSSGEGPYRSNLELSAERSIKVLSFWVSNSLIAPADLTTAARVSSEPIYSNINADSSVLNEEIQIKIIDRDNNE